MHIAFRDLVPDVGDFLKLEVEEVAGVLLLHLNGIMDAHRHTGGINYRNFFECPPRQDYDRQQDEVNRALMEAWAWLKNSAFLVESPGLTHDFYFISRRGKAITSRADFSKYRNAGLLPKDQLHPTIASKVYPAFLRGDYDTAVFEAFREVEVGVREGGGYNPSDTGVDLMRKAFKPEDKNKPNSGSGNLTDKQLQPAEQEAMAHLFAGAFGFYRNPVGHRHVLTSAQEAAEIISFASQLLRIVDRLRP